ncbi:MAG: hypothetical protein ABI665_26030 [Vicinamibacterales bacterium]
MRFGRALIAAALLLFPAGAPAQDHQGHQADAVHDAGMMTLFPTRNASGTAWQPAQTPMTGFHGTAGEWLWMGQASVFAQFLYESGGVHRTSRQPGSINWFMGMARRPLGRGRVGLRAMLSAEPWTIAGCGYPDLLATGEICDGDSIHDRQHPHDLFMELAVDYERPITERLRLHAYAAMAGEPALGPPAFPHRASAFPNPIAPISHHWLDATHIAFGVVTAGVSGSRWRAEASVFNGREPDDSRANVEIAALDSFAARVSVAPGERWSLQASAGRLHEAEAGLGSQPRQDVDRATASAIYFMPMRGAGAWATTMAYGVNHGITLIPGGAIEQTTHAVLAETSLRSGSGRHNWFARVEVVGKPADDLHVHEYVTRIFTVGKLQVGYLRQFARFKGWAPGIGAHLNLSALPSLLAPRYNGRVAPGLGVFVNVQPASN